MNTGNGLNRYFRPYLIKAGSATLGTTKRGEERIVSKFRVYDQRYTHATMLLEANVNPKIVSERLGRASITLDTHSHVLPTTQDTAVTALGSSLYKPSPALLNAPLN